MKFSSTITSSCNKFPTNTHSLDKKAQIAHQAASASEQAFSTGYYGEYGGQYVPEPLKICLNEVSKAFTYFRNNEPFNTELNELYANYCGRPSPIFYCKNLSKKLGGAHIYLKREDLNHLGAHKINNTLGQVLLAKHMGKKTLVAETGAGQHGVATAATAALFGMECIIYMGEEDTKRQSLNVMRMRMMGAEVRPVLKGQRTLKEAVDEALECFIHNPSMFYVLGSAVGPHPYPSMVRHFQSIIGIEARKQCLEQLGGLPNYSIACIGGGSNAIGLFSGFLKDESVHLVGVEPGGTDLKLGMHAATLCLGTKGILHGFKSYLLQDEKGNAAPVYSISAGLDYPGVGPEHCMLKDIGRAEYVTISDKEAIDALLMLSCSEGIIPALESSHALAYALHIAPTLTKDTTLLVCLSGRGDKDLDHVVKMLNQ